jgi:hypothetical protein
LIGGQQGGNFRMATREILVVQGKLMAIEEVGGEIRGGRE